ERFITVNDLADTERPDVEIFPLARAYRVQRTRRLILDVRDLGENDQIRSADANVQGPRRDRITDVGKRGRRRQEKQGDGRQKAAHAPTPLKFHPPEARPVLADLVPFSAPLERCRPE